MGEPTMLKMTATLALALWLASCGKVDSPTAANAPHATVRMRDGSQVAGAVLSTSSTEVKLLGDDNVTRSIPMTQVRSIDYGDAPATAAAAVPNSAPNSAQARPPAPAPSEAVHERHEHPVPAAVTTR